MREGEQKVSLRRTWSPVPVQASFPSLSALPVWRLGLRQQHVSHLSASGLKPHLTRGLWLLQELYVQRVLPSRDTGLRVFSKVWSKVPSELLALNQCRSLRMHPESSLLSIMYLPLGPALLDLGPELLQPGSLSPASHPPCSIIPHPTFAKPLRLLSSLLGSSERAPVVLGCSLDPHFAEKKTEQGQELG